MTSIELETDWLDTTGRAGVRQLRLLRGPPLSGGGTEDQFSRSSASHPLRKLLPRRQSPKRPTIRSRRSHSLQAIDFNFKFPLHFPIVTRPLVRINSDPADYSDPEGEKYPNSYYLPGEGVQRGTIVWKDGDSSTPMYPALRT